MVFYNPWLTRWWSTSICLFVIWPQLKRNWNACSTTAKLLREISILILQHVSKAFFSTQYPDILQKCVTFKNDHEINIQHHYLSLLSPRERKWWHPVFSLAEMAYHRKRSPWLNSHPCLIYPPKSSLTCEFIRLHINFEVVMYRCINRWNRDEGKTKKTKTKYLAGRKASCSQIRQFSRGISLQKGQWFFYAEERIRKYFSEHSLWHFGLRHLHWIPTKKNSRYFVHFLDSLCNCRTLILLLAIP